jgi:hypothetical protein
MKQLIFNYMPYGPIYSDEAPSPPHLYYFVGPSDILTLFDAFDTFDVRLSVSRLLFRDPFIRRVGDPSPPGPHTITFRVVN